MTAFALDGRDILLRFDPDERRVLAGLAAGLVEMLVPEPVAGAEEANSADPLAAMVGLATPPLDAPSDPALRRLLPDAYADPQQAAEFRRLTDADARAAKAAKLRRLVDATAAPDGEARVTPADIDGWLAALNDIRLVLGERLEMTEEREHLEHLAADDPRRPLLAAYDWLAELQEVLVHLASD